MKAKKKLIISMFFVILFSILTDDVFSQHDVDTVQYETQDYLIIHYNENSDSVQKILWYMYIEISTGKKKLDDIFEYNYTYSRIYMIKKSTGDTIINYFTIPFNSVQLSENNKYIIGMSKKRSSPYNIIVFDSNGNLIFKRHIGVLEAKMNKRDFKNFRENYFDDYDLLKRLNRIHKYKGNWYIDYRLGLGRLEESVFDLEVSLLRPYNVYNHIIVPSITTSGKIMFYSDNKPISRIKGRKGKLKWIEINYRYGEKYKIHVY